MIDGLARKLEILRSTHGYSCAFVGDKVLKSAQIISDYETGKCEPSLKVLIKLANLYNVSTDYLLGIDEMENKEKVDPEHFLDIALLTDTEKDSLRLVRDNYIVAKEKSK